MKLPKARRLPSGIWLFIFFVPILLLVIAAMVISHDAEMRDREFYRDIVIEHPLFAYVDKTLTLLDAQELESAIRNIPNVADVIFVDQNQALEEFLSSLDNPSRYSDINASWLRHRYVVYINDIKIANETQDALRKVRGIEEVNVFSYDIQELRDNHDKEILGLNTKAKLMWSFVIVIGLLAGFFFLYSTLGKRNH